jgi:hypothetical protein
MGKGLSSYERILCGRMQSTGNARLSANATTYIGGVKRRIGQSNGAVDMSNQPGPAKRKGKPAPKPRKPRHRNIKSGRI